MVQALRVRRSAARRSPARKGQRTAPRRRVILLFVLPALLLYVGLFAYPVLSSLANSFFLWRGTNRLGFAGFENYQQLLSLQPYARQFSKALGNNVIFFVGTMVLQNGAGFLLALLLHRSIKGRWFFQTILSIPYLMSALVIGYAWSMLLSPQFGVVNALLGMAGLEGHAWLGDPALFMPILILINAWQWVGVPMLIFGAALNAIPAETIEAAKVDGASFWRIVRSVQLPQMIPSLSVVTVLTFIGSLNLFDLVYAVGGSSGGPRGAGDVLATLFYRVSFGNDLNSIGLSGAMSMIQLLIILGATLVIQRGLAALHKRFVA